MHHYSEEYLITEYFSVSALLLWTFAAAAFFRSVYFSFSGHFFCLVTYLLKYLHEDTSCVRERRNVKLKKQDAGGTIIATNAENPLLPFLAHTVSNCVRVSILCHPANVNEY